MNEKKNYAKGEEELKERYYCSSDDMTVCDTICDVCIFRIPEDDSCCKKYPEGKPDELMDPDYYCPLCEMTELGF